MAKLGPEHAHIFRITHIDNVPWILKHGLHCQSSGTKDPNFVPIGLAGQIYYCEGLEKLASNMEEVRPTLMFVVSNRPIPG